MLIGIIATAGSFEEVSAIFGIGIVVTLIVSVIVIIYYCKILKSLNMAIRSAKDNVPYPNASRFVGVMCFVGAVGALFGIVNLSILGIIQAILTMMQMIIFGVLVFKYRNEMRTAAYETGSLNQPTY